MSETMRQQIEAEARAARGKLPPAVGVARARPAGFPTASAAAHELSRQASFKREADSEYSPSLDELKAIDAVVVEQTAVRLFCEAESVCAARSSYITEARAGARRDALPAVGIPEGGNSPALLGQPHGTCLFPTDQPPGEAVAESPGLPHPASAPEVQAAMLDVQRAAKRPKKLLLFELTEREFLHAHSAVEQDRNRTRKAIKKGQAVPQDLKASESLWHKLQEAAFARLKGGAA